MVLPMPLLGLSALASRSATDPAEPVVTPPPNFRRQESSSYDSRFVGFSIYGTSVSAQSCNPDQFFWIDSKRVDCCATTATNWMLDCVDRTIVTDCVGSTAMFFDGSTVCSDYCGTDTFYTGSTRDSSSILWLGCYEADNEYFYERPLVSPSTSPTSSSFTTSQPSFSELSVTAASRPPPSSVASQTSSSTPTELEKSAPTKQPSKAWIAGVVVGGVALVAIAGLIFYLLRTRKRNKEETMYQVAPQMMQGSPQQPYPESYAGLSPDVTSPIPPYEDNKTIYAHRVSQQGFNANTASWYAPPEGTIRPPSTAQTMASATARPESELPTIHDLPILINPPQPRK